MKKRFALIILSIIGYGLMATPTSGAQSPELFPLLISGFQVSGTKEFIELYNPNEAALSPTAWKVTYTNASGNNLQTVIKIGEVFDPQAHKLFASNDYALTEQLADKLVPYSPLLYSGMADGGGFLRLYEEVEIGPDYPDGYRLVETIGWKNTSTLSTDLLVIPLVGLTSAKRCTDALGEYVSRQNNQTDFYVSSTATLLEKGNVCPELVVLPEEPAPEVTPEEPPVVVPVLSCEGIIFSEILPNPEGVDGGREFIELYNPTQEVIDLKGCKVEASDGVYEIKDAIFVEPGAHFSLSDSVSLITLPNSNGDTLKLVSAANVELSTVTYPPELDDDQAWALSEGVFATTYEATPGSANVILVLRPCPEGQQRDSTTNYCRNIVVESEQDDEVVCESNEILNVLTNRCNKVQNTLVECRDGQVRNPETNRCRSVVNGTLVSSLVPCLAGQERNPETNRCKSIQISQLTPCKEGQERNPETNRCRTIVLASTDTETVVRDVVSKQKDDFELPLGLIVAGLALSYAVYEWRLEIVSLGGRMMRRFKSKI